MSILSSLAFYFAYIFIRVMSFSFNFLFHDLSVNFVIPLYVCCAGGGTAGQSEGRVEETIYSQMNLVRYILARADGKVAQRI